MTTNRKLEQRQVLGGGWTTEWEPATLEQARGHWVGLPDETRARLHRVLTSGGPVTENGWRLLVRALNEAEKATGSNVRWRSVAEED